MEQSPPEDQQQEQSLGLYAQQGYDAVPVQLSVLQQQQQSLGHQEYSVNNQGAGYAVSGGGFAVGMQSTFSQSEVQEMAVSDVSYSVGGDQSLGQQTVDPAVDVIENSGAGHDVEIQSTFSQSQEVEVVDPAAADDATQGEVEQQPEPMPPEEGLAELSNFKDTWADPSPTDIPILWHVPESGGNAIHSVIGGCHRLVQATGFGRQYSTNVLGIVYPEGEGSPFVNIDSTTREGIQRAKNLGFADAQVADVVVSPSPLLFESNDLFTPTAQGRLFAVFRHPIERAFILFKRLQEAEPWTKNWTLVRYAKSDMVENNHLTRLLSNQPSGELAEDHIKKAVEVIRQKFLVGLASKPVQTMARFEQFFHWTYRINPHDQEACRKGIMSDAASTVKMDEKLAPKEGDPAWAWLEKQNNFDLRLYAYVKTLFEEQAAFVKRLPEDLREVGATCCSCQSPTFPPIEPVDVDNEGKSEIQIVGGHRLFHQMPPSLISASFIPCKIDDKLSERTLMLRQSTFAGCLGKGFNVCQGIINAAIRSNPGVFSDVAPDSFEQMKQQQIIESEVIQPQLQSAQEEDGLPELINFKDTWDPLSLTDIPIFWNFPESGGNIIRHIMGGCHRLVQAAGSGNKEHAEIDVVGIVYPEGEGSPFVNVDSTTRGGIQHAKSMKFADAQVADVVVSPFIFESNDLFTPTAQGRLFAVFRHPMDRALNSFSNLQETEPSLKGWTFEQYFKSDMVENNRLTRVLSNQLSGELTEDHYRKAAEIIRRKFLVGLANQIEPTMTRFEKFFHWTYRLNPPEQEKCRTRVIAEGDDANKKNEKNMPQEGDPAWTWLTKQNEFDLRLYAYAEKLFEEQETFVKNLPDGVRYVGSTCCKCQRPTFPPREEFEVGNSLQVGGHRIFRQLPPSLVSALFVPCMPDERRSFQTIQGQ